MVAGPLKFYAVRKGRETGLFPSWAACERQIRGFSRAEHKSFHTKEEAEAWLAAGKPEPLSSTSLTICPSIPSALEVQSLTQAASELAQGRSTRWLLRFDGAARGNPGPAGAGAILQCGTGTLWRGYAYVGPRNTNNEAEYEALLLGLRVLPRIAALGRLSDPLTHLTIEGDSQLIVRQLTGVYAVRQPRLRALHAEALRELEGLRGNGKVVVVVQHVLRASNREADELANAAVDSQACWEEFSPPLSHDGENLGLVPATGGRPGGENQP
eukprot:EG_transcript_18175